MPISMNINKTVNVNGNVFSLAEFIHYVNLNGLGKYKETLESLFRASTLVEKEHESITQYCTRLFYLLYYKKGFGQHDILNTTNSNNNSTSVPAVNNTSYDEYSILETLGINMVKHCKKISKIIFKNTGNQYRMKNENIEKLIESIKKHNTFQFTNHEIKFGVELEFIGINARSNIKMFSEHMIDLVGEDRYNEDLRYNHNDGKQWVLGRDGSLRGNGYGFELTSPIFTYGNKADLDELEAVIELVKTDLEGECNRSCGTHVHMSFDLDKEVNFLVKEYFATAYSMSEECCFDKLVPFYRRENHNQYCRSVDVNYIGDRYRKLNLTTTHIADHTSNMHIEFRQLDGNLDFDKLMTWIKLQKLFIESTLDSFYSNPNFWESSVGIEKSIKPLVLEDVICSNACNNTNVEKLLTMSKMAS